MTHSRHIYLLVLAFTVTGCTATQLRRSTVNQAKTQSDIYQQQVMDNLAKFAYDFGSLPHFSIASAGSALVTDSGSIGYSATWTGGSVTNFLNPSASRSAQLGWTMSPISDPRKLELMRCAYQTAIKPCLGIERAEECPSCTKLFNHFYTGDPEVSVPSPSPDGTITSNCIHTDICWLGFGCKKCIPKHCPCDLVGSYCDMYVWLLPGGQEQLTKLTITVLDYAIKDPAQLPPEDMKTVVTYFDAENKLTTKDKAVAEVTEIIPANQSPIDHEEPAQNKPGAGKRKFSNMLPSQRAAPLPQRQNSPLSPLLYFPLLRQQQQTLTPTPPR
jgi:hypothetical protein